MPAKTSPYNVQCIIHGFCGQATKEYHPELYAKCQKYEADGFIDALCLGPGNDFCGQCSEEAARRRNSSVTYLHEIQDPDSLWYLKDKTEREEMVQKIRNELGLSCDS